MSVAWTAAGGPHGAKNYNDIVRKYGLAATRDFLKEADPVSYTHLDVYKRQVWSACAPAGEMTTSSAGGTMMTISDPLPSANRCTDRRHTGDDLVLLMEDAARTHTLDLLEMDYYRNLIEDHRFEPVSYTHLDVYKRQKLLQMPQ